VPIEPAWFGRHCLVQLRDADVEMIKETMLVRLWKAAWRLLVVAAFSASSAVAAQAQPFSADIVTRRDEVSAPAGRLSVRDGKVRIETTEHPDGFFLVDPAKPSAYFVRPGTRLYMEARQSSQLTRLFVPVDPDVPCRQWQAMARLAGMTSEGEWRCERTGEETIDGHSTVAFRAAPGEGEVFFGWIDRERQFPLQIRTGDGVLFKLEQIKDEPQPASSFEFPAAYKKFSPEALIERIKQSDVWVAKPGDAEASRPLK
jgi:hypothetical protein